MWLAALVDPSPALALLVTSHFGAQGADYFSVLSGKRQLQSLATRLDRIIHPGHSAVDGSKHVVRLPIPATTDLDGLLQLRNGVG